MSSGQRIVSVVALGAIAVVVANTLNAVLDQPDGGWFMYAPNSTVTYESTDDGATIRAALIWLAATGTWLGLSWHILRDRSPKR
jgi:hypothetical protein